MGGSAAPSFQLVVTWDESFGWKTTDTDPSYLIRSHEVLKIANTIWKCACILLHNFTQVLWVKHATFTYSSRQEQQLWFFVDLKRWVKVQTQFHRCEIWILFAKKLYSWEEKKAQQSLAPRSTLHKVHPNSKEKWSHSLLGEHLRISVCK